MITSTSIPSSTLFFDTLNPSPRVLGRMYPYKRRLTWVARGAHRHLIDAIRQEKGAFTAKQGGIMERRLKTMAIWIKIRAALLLFLSASVISAAYGFISEAFGGVEGPQAADTAIAVFTRIATTFASGFAVLYFLALRVLDQLRADVIVSLAIQASHDRFS